MTLLEIPPIANVFCVLLKLGKVFIKTVVYIVPCDECNKCYIAQSGKILCERLGQHKNSVRLGHSNNRVFKHARDTNHAVNWENSKMVFSSVDPYQRLVVEVSLIKKKTYQFSIVHNSHQPLKAFLALSF